MFSSRSRFLELWSSGAPESWSRAAAPGGGGEGAKEGSGSWRGRWGGKREGGEEWGE